MNNILPINKVICGDAIEQLKLFPDNHFDSIVTDPPAGIEFMGKEWDSFKTNKRSKGWSQQNKEGGDTFGGFGKKLMPSFYSQTKKDRDNFINYISEIMGEGLRVLKPGGHALVWALPRTSHWTAMALEDAGFEIRDCIYHVFGSGFPKSLSIGKAIDKLQDNKREVIGDKPYTTQDIRGNAFESEVARERPRLQEQITKGTTVWEGWGTALKPAVECWWLVRKPISENTIAENVLKWGTGGINIDGCRVPTGDTLIHGGRLGVNSGDERTGKALGMFQDGTENTFVQNTLGRFPANLIHDGSDEVLALFPQSKGQQGDVKGTEQSHTGDDNTNCYGEYKRVSSGKRGDGGSAARFFYCAKPSRSERDKGLDGAKLKPIPYSDYRENFDTTKSYVSHYPDGTPRPMNESKNNHPTVKSQALMEYLIKLITPPNSIGLDMFAGSGSTLIAYKKLGHRYIGIEIDPDYCKIAEQRLIADLNGNRSLDAYD